MPPFEISVENQYWDSNGQLITKYTFFYVNAKRVQHFPHDPETGAAELVEIFTENDTIVLTFEDSVEVRKTLEKGGAIE